jgi:uncharacterized coiled-coil protein SlyX
MSSNLENKINDMEALISHQSVEIAELNDVVTKQWAEIDALKKYIQLTKSKLQELEHSIGELGSGEGRSVSDEAAANKPPHY